MTFKPLVALLVALLFCAIVPSALAQTSTSVTFQISDESGVGLQDATVCFDGVWHPCDTSGRVSIPTTRGEHTWVANAPGRVVTRGTVTVDGDERVESRMPFAGTSDGSDDDGSGTSGGASGFEVSLNNTCCISLALLVVIVVLYLTKRYGLW
jgi:hypothetical protein